MNEEFSANFHSEFDDIDSLLTGQIRRLPTSIDVINGNGEQEINRLFPSYDKVLELSTQKEGEGPIRLTESTGHDDDYIVLRSEIYNPDNSEASELVETFDRKMERIMEILVPEDDPKIHSLFEFMEIDYGPKIPEYQVRAARFEPGNPYDEDELYEEARRTLEDEGRIVAVGPV